VSRLFPGSDREISGFPSRSKRLCRTRQVLLKVAEHRYPAGTIRFFSAWDFAPAVFSRACIKYRFTS
jgi:hypothetical protein